MSSSVSSQPPSLETSSASSSVSVDGPPTAPLVDEPARPVVAPENNNNGNDDDLPYLLLAGCFLLFCVHGSRWIGFLLWGNSYDNASATMKTTALDFELAVLSTLSGCFRSIIMTVISLMVLPSLFTNQTDVNNNMAISRNLLFHLQCRLFVGLAMCLAPSNIPPMVVEFTVLVVSTCRQSVFQ